MPDNQTITWLHLSDWHQEGPDFERKVVCDALIKDIRAREAIDPALARVDFVVFSGDLAFSGAKEEYNAIRTNLLDPVLNAIHLEPDHLFIAPGNHDLDRAAFKYLPVGLQQPFTSSKEVNAWMLDAEDLAHLLRPFKTYSEFVGGYTKQTTPAFASIARLNIGGKVIALLGLNSALMSGRHRDEHGDIDDARRLVVGVPQIHDALEQIADADVRIAVLHHPFEWLAPFDRARVQALLGRECHFILHGHEHTPKVQVLDSTEGNYVLIPAGASFERQQAEAPRYTNAYNWVHLDLSARQGMVYLRRWSDPRMAWIEDTDSHPGGKFILKSLPKQLFRCEEKRTTVTPEQPQTASAITPTPIPVHTPLLSPTVPIPLTPTSIPVQGEPVILTLAPGITISLVRVPASEFTMGSRVGDPSARSDEKPQHNVYLDEYLIAKCPVTVAQFGAFVQASGYKADSRTLRTGKDSHPVNYVSWEDASAFCQWASQVTGRNVRLPTEAEWEKAARGVDGRIYPWGNDEPDSNRCNFNNNIGDTTPVGKYSPTGDSPYGCADMAGNVWEWVNDWYAGDYYISSPGSNPPGPATGTGRMVRGGSWYRNASTVRSANRNLTDLPGNRGGRVGFRCAVSLPATPLAEPAAQSSGNQDSRLVKPKITRRKFLVAGGLVVGTVVAGIGGNALIKRLTSPKQLVTIPTSPTRSATASLKHSVTPASTPTATASISPVSTSVLVDPLVLNLAPGVEMPLVRVPAGEFTMGSSNGDPGVHSYETPQHPVYLDEYQIGKYEVTVAQFRAFVQTTGYSASSSALRTGKDNHPVNYVNWDDAIAFCTWASQVTERTVRLPTEAEWEKAARGTDGRFYPWGDAPVDNTHCNFSNNVNDTEPVDYYSPTGDSFYRCAGMAGNVYEWVNDWYQEDYYDSSPGSNPPGPATGTERVLRGGGWNSSWDYVYTIHRKPFSPGVRNHDVGFRCAVSPGT